MRFGYLLTPLCLLSLKVGQEIEVRPGIVSKDHEGKLMCKPIFSKIVSLFAEHNDLQYAVPGGLIGMRYLMHFSVCLSHLILLLKAFGMSLHVCMHMFGLRISKSSASEFVCEGCNCSSIDGRQKSSAMTLSAYFPHFKTQDTLQEC